MKKLKNSVSGNTNKLNPSTLFIIQPKNGKHYIDLNETGHGDLSKAEDSVLAYVKDPAENSGFLAKDGEGTLYYKRYLLAKRAAREGAPAGYIDEWYLKGIVNIAPEVKPTPAVDTISAIGEYNLYMLHSIQDDFHRRIGFLKGLENEKDVWARVTHNNLKSRGDNYFKAHNSQYEVGFNFNKKIEEDKTIFTGVSLDFIDGKVSLRNTSGKQELYMIGLYHSRVGKDGSYSDFTAHFGNNRYGKMGIYKDNDIIEIEKRKSNLWNLSYEYGKHLTHENYFIEPQVQLSYTQLNSNKGDIHKDNDLYRIEYSPTKSLLGRAGVMAGTTILRDGEKRGEVYLLFNLLHEFKGNTKYSIEGEKESLSRSHKYHKTFEEIGLGFNYNYSENTSYYFDIRTNVGRTPVRNMQWNFGLRHKF